MGTGGWRPPRPGRASKLLPDQKHSHKQGREEKTSKPHGLKEAQEHTEGRRCQLCSRSGCWGFWCVFFQFPPVSCWCQPEGELSAVITHWGLVLEGVRGCSPGQTWSCRHHSLEQHCSLPQLSSPYPSGRQGSLK